MKQSVIILALTLGITGSIVAQKKKYKPTTESLSTYQIPEWFLDAKFGIYAHWGPVSSAFEGIDPDKWYGGWHGKQMYEDGQKVPTKSGQPTNNHVHHKEKYGDPAEYGYKYLIEQFDPSGFDAEVWADLFQKSGAKFAGPVAMHHDNFAMWDSKATRWNAMNYGGIDPSADLKKEIEARGMKFMASFHHAFTWKYFAPAHAYGGVAPEDYDLYTNPHSLESDTPDADFYKNWWAVLKEYIDTYQPDLLWFDWWLENMSEETRYEFLSYYYNQAEKWGKEVGVAYKESTFSEDMAIKDYERGRPNQPKNPAWLTDTSPGAWFYRPNAKFKTPNDLVDILVDIVSKNGLMLLNVPPNPDGTIPQVMENLLVEMGEWLETNGEAIYGTRPWLVFGEGPTRLPEGGHKVEKLEIIYTDRDIRYTKKSDKEFYAIVMDKTENDIVMKTLSTDIGVLNSQILEVSLLGSDEKLSWKRNHKGLVITAPKQWPGNYAYAFKIKLEGYVENNIGGDVAAHVD
ncbi:MULTISPECIES: alpha-L-fucosidase [Reichenbachiella]|uniref:alpha-L-fucosidase n=1 Tax=Reichenbachiella TaxID=156993 RepID=UPI000E6CBF0D|nr:MULTISPECIES: alpha-L-fucosidase [Reichenbachiella]MBU2912624.1 alpha-L-fucosidase [Reichenbachiella agariperforans]RJE72527.1 alpha-L-fucosidase [Reichenbachiella sp. MSK19-1]